jgi:hypothetical protein
MVGKEWVFDISRLKKLGFEPLMKREEIVKDLVNPEDFPIP